jgi:hypothetical protein
LVALGKGQRQVDIVTNDPCHSLEKAMFGLKTHAPVIDQGAIPVV